MDLNNEKKWKDETTFSEIYFGSFNCRGRIPLPTCENIWNQSPVASRILKFPYVFVFHIFARKQKCKKIFLDVEYATKRIEFPKDSFLKKTK